MAARSKAPPEVRTIGSIIAQGLHMTTNCDVEKCHHSQTLDLETLAQELGSDYPVADFVARSRCSKCGARWPKLSVRVGPMTQKSTGQG